MVSAIICNNGWLIVPSVPDYRLMDICWPPHGSYQHREDTDTSRMLSAIICNNGWLIVTSMPDYRLMDICWLMDGICNNLQ